MRIKTILTTLAVAAVAGGGFLAVQAGGDNTTGTELALTASPAGGAGLDLGHKGTSPGDEFLEHGDLHGAQGAAGRFQMTAQLVYGGAREGGEQSTVVLYLPTGQLVAVGGHKTQDRYGLPIVGGTGSYSTARGTLGVAPGPHGTERLDVQIER